MAGPVFVARCRARGLTVVEMVVDGKSWLDNNRNHVGPWADLFGDLIHHTGSDTSNPFEYAKFLFRGRSDLPGPLCQRGTAPDGTVYMIGWGRANHAGSGDTDTLNLIKADAMPFDREIKPDQSGPSDGNRALYGNEVMYSGGHPMTAAQLESCLIQDEVICGYHGWSAASVGGHKEWTNQKPDPGYLNMGQYRTVLARRLAGTQPPPPPPEIKRDADMRIIRSNETGACYEVGPNLCQHIETIERLDALEAVWGRRIEMPQDQVQRVWDQTVDDILATRSNFNVPDKMPSDPPA